MLDCSIQAVLARMLMNQLWPTVRLESLRTRTGRIAAAPDACRMAAFRALWPRCQRELKEKLWALGSLKTLKRSVHDCNRISRTSPQEV